MRLPSARPLALSLAALLAIGVAGSAAVADPPGNNGTVKIGREPFGFAAGRPAPHRLRVPGRPPRVRRRRPVRDRHLHRDHRRRLDAARTCDLNDGLADVDANPNQGVHVRLTVHADGATIADTKSKTFWAQGCVREQQEN